MILGTISYLLIIAFNVLIYRKLTSLKSTMSAKTCEVHRQLSKVLKYQVRNRIILMILIIITFYRQWYHFLYVFVH